MTSKRWNAPTYKTVLQINSPLYSSICWVQSKEHSTEILDKIQRTKNKKSSYFPFIWWKFIKRLKNKGGTEDSPSSSSKCTKTELWTKVKAAVFQVMTTVYVKKKNYTINPLKGMISVIITDLYAWKTLLTFSSLSFITTVNAASLKPD